MKKPDIKPGFFGQRSVSVTLVTFGQVAAHRATSRTAQTCANRGAGLAAQAVANHRTTGCTNAAANRCFRPATLARRHCATCRTCDASTKCRASAAAHFLADDITQCATQTTAQRSGAITGSHCTLSNQKPKNQSGQC
jgi:hypothetical protein